MTAMGAPPTAPKVSHTYAEVLQRFGRKFVAQIPDDYDPPFYASHLWTMFWHFSYRRQSSDGNPFAIAYGELLAYMQCTGEYLSPLEVDAIVAMDDTFRKQLAETRDHQRSFNKTPESQGQQAPPKGIGKGKKKLGG